MYSSLRANLYTEMNKLQEANILLREKNLQLNQQLHTKSRDGIFPWLELDLNL